MFYHWFGAWQVLVKRDRPNCILYFTSSSSASYEMSMKIDLSCSFVKSSRNLKNSYFCSKRELYNSEFYEFFSRNKGWTR